VREAGITLSPKKCHFTYTSILLLGQKVSWLGLSMHDKKVRAITKLAAPMNLCSLQSFLGMAVYFSHYIPRYALLATPLFELLRKNAKWNWGRTQEEAFQMLQQALASAPVLGHPIQGHPFWIYSDALDMAIGACLQQVQPIHLGDMKGTKIHTLVTEAHSKGLSVPWITKPASTCTPDVPDPGEWASPLENMVIHVERVLVYWSHTLKAAEKNYSVME